jgi:CHAD domain-containing protein
VLAVLCSERYTRLLTQLEAAANAPDVAPAITSLAEMAAAAYKRLQKAMRALGPEASAEELHRVRIYGKRARYAAELAQAIVGKPASRFLEQAKAFQDLLGEHQDTMVAEIHLRTLLRHTRGTLAAFTIGRLVERLQASRLSLRAALPAAWAKLARRGQKAFQFAGDS